MVIRPIVIGPIVIRPCEVRLVVAAAIPDVITRDSAVLFRDGKEFHQICRFSG